MAGVSIKMQQKEKTS